MTADLDKDSELFYDHDNINENLLVQHMNVNTLVHTGKHPIKNRFGIFTNEEDMKFLAPLGKRDHIGLLFKLATSAIVIMNEHEANRLNRVHGDLSWVADGFWCRQCDGTIQEADLDEYLMVDGETHGCVKSFCYLGDTLDGDGGADLAATSRIRNGWMKFRELLPFMTSRAPLLEMKGQVYAGCSMNWK